MASSDFHVGDLQGQIEEINEHIVRNKLESSIDITNYTSANKYAFPSDGYVDIYGGGSGEAIRAEVCGSNDNIVLNLYQAGSEHFIVYVKAGMKCYKVSATSTNPLIAFKPLS